MALFALERLRLSYNLLRAPFLRLAGDERAKSVGAAEILRKIAPVSSYGRARASSFTPFTGKDEKAAAEHFFILAKLKARLDAEEGFFAKVKNALERLPDVDDCLRSLPNVDFNELSRLFFALRSVCELTESANEAGCAVELGLAERAETVFAAFDALSEASDSKTGFSLKSGISNELKNIRRELKLLSGELEDRRKNALAKTRASLGLEPEGLADVVAATDSSLYESLKICPDAVMTSDGPAAARFRILAPKELRYLEERMAELISLEKSETDRICRTLGEKILPLSGAVSSALEACGRLDFILAVYETQRGESPLCLPVFEKAAATIKLDSAYLPSLAKRLGGAYQPLSISLPVKVCALNGANMSGKTVVLKTIACNALLAACGIMPYAKAFNAPPFDALYYREPGSGDARLGLSAFGEEIAFAGELLACGGGERVLALLDEPFRTTDAVEGEALLLAIIESLSAKPNMAVLASTHYALDGAPQSVPFFHMAGLADEKAAALALEKGASAEEIGRYMNYKVIDGKERDSRALQIASLLGLPQSVIERAKSILNS